MTIQEFEKLAGYEVNYDDYVNIIEPMYMAVELSKVDFVQCINRKRFEVKKKTERQYINEIEDGCNSTLATVLGREACICGRMMTWDELIRDRQRYGDQPDLKQFR